MKKMIQKMLIGLVGLMASSGAFAVYPDLTAGGNPILVTECPQLANDINITISDGVLGSLDCDNDDTIVGLAVCHTTGLTTNRSATESADANGDCPAGFTADTERSTCVSTVSGPAFPYATTASGTVKSDYPGGDCTLGDTSSVAADKVTAAAN